MAIQLTGSGLDNIGINPSVDSTGQFTALNTTTGNISITQDLNFSVGGTPKAQLNTSGNLKLLSETSAFKNSVDDAITPYAAFRNKIINGNFDIWQRATSQTSHGYGSDDRWLNGSVGSTKTHSQQAFALGQTAVPNNPTYYSRTVVTSVVGAANYIAKWQNIEDVSKSSGKTFTLTFWAKADANRNIAIEFYQHFGTGGSPSTEVRSIGVTTFALTTSWQKFTTTVTFSSVSGKTLGTNNDDYYGVGFYFDAGSSLNSRTNSLGQQSGTFDIAQVQLEEGSAATPFESRPLAVEQVLCQRYYEKNFGISLFAVNGYSAANGSGGAALWVSFAVTKRVAPSVTKVGTWIINSVQAQPAVAGITTGGCSLYAVGSATTTGCGWQTDSVDDGLTIDAELL